MAIKIDAKDLKPILQATGIAAPDDDERPDIPVPPQIAAAPPMPPPPTPASAGYAAYAADPQNAAKVANSIVPPGQSVMPPSAGTAALTAGQIATHSPSDPNMPPPVTPNALPTYDAWAASHPGQVAKPTYINHGGGFKGFLGNALDIATPALLGAAGGLHGDPEAGVNYVAGRVAADRAVPELNQQRYQAAVVQPAKEQAAIADTYSQSRKRDADAELQGQKSEDLEPFTMSPTQAAALNQPQLAGTQTTMRDYNRLLGMAGRDNTSRTNNQATNDTRETNTQTNSDTRKALTESTNQTKALIAAHHDATSRANNADNNARSESNNANTNNHKAVAGGASAGTGGNFKVPADVTKRAALASNVLENAGEVEKILDKRPDIIGAVAGRYSNAQQMIGSDDPDIQALGVRMHNMALASNGAHGVRAQQAIQKTEDELFSNFHAGPHAIKGALNATRGSMQTFLDDERNFSTTGQRTGGMPSLAPGSKQGSGDMITVQIPGQAPGQIHASQKAAFLAKYPNAKVQ